MTREAPPRLPAAFNRLAGSNLAAQSAEQISLAATPLIAVFALGAGASQTGLLQMAQTLPFLLLSIPAGILADRCSRRGLMAIAEMLRACSILMILALATTGLLTLPLLGFLGFAGACGTVAYSVAAPSLVPALVPHAALAAANGHIELARSVAFAAGPALAGAMISWVGAPPAFLPRRSRSSQSCSSLACTSLSARRFRRAALCATWPREQASPSVIGSCVRYC